MTMCRQPYHLPVLLEEVVHFLKIGLPGNILDATAGGGGHTARLLQEIRDNSVIVAVDRDRDAIERLTDRFASEPAIKVVRSNFSDIGNNTIIRSNAPYAGMVFDFGMSSHMIDDAAARGFSFQEDGPLDMRMDQTQDLDAKQVVNNSEEDDLAVLFRKYGDLHEARTLARLIVNNRPLNTTMELAGLIQGRFRGEKGFKLCRRVFQSVRIFVNDELEAITQALNASMMLLKSGGICVLLSYHSLEDKICKEFIKTNSKNCYCDPRSPVCTCGGNNARVKNLTPRIIRASAEEQKSNSRSRSVIMRAFERC